jgi:hypothetical protein
MKKGLDIEKELAGEKSHASKEEQLLLEAKKILIQNQLSEKNILDNLKFYKTSFEFLDEEEITSEKIFSLQQIRSTAIKLRLRFLPSQAFDGEIPYEAVLKIKNLNHTYRKELKHFKVLSSKKFFSENNSTEQAVLFAQTLYDNYYPIHTWGTAFAKSRKVKFFLLRNFEAFAGCLLLFTLIECLLIPNKYLSTDWRATYFSMYRAAAYFHLLILNAGLLIFLLFGFNCNFSAQIWDSPVKKMPQRL